MDQEGHQPRTSWRPRRRDRREVGFESAIAALEAAWHRAERTQPERALSAAVELADALAASGRERAAAGLLARALALGSPDDPAAPHAGLRLGDLAFALGHLDDAARGYEWAIAGGVELARVQARHGLFLAARGEHHQARRRLTAALFDADGPAEIETAARVLLTAAAGANRNDAAAWANGAREGFRVVRATDLEARAAGLVRELRHQLPEEWSARYATGEFPVVVH